MPSPVNYYSILSVLFVGITTTIILVRFIQNNASEQEKRRKKTARKLKFKNDKHLRNVVAEILVDHTGAEERATDAIARRLDGFDVRLDTLEALIRGDRRLAPVQIPT